MADATKWEPTDCQRALLKVYQDADYQISVTDACSKAGINRVTYYAYWETAGFREWWIAEASKFFGRDLPKVLQNLRSGAAAVFDKDTPKPDSALVKLFLERFDADYKPKSASEITGANGGPLVIMQETINVQQPGNGPAAGDTHAPDPVQP